MHEKAVTTALRDRHWPQVSLRHVRVRLRSKDSSVRTVAEYDPAGRQSLTAGRFGRSKSLSGGCGWGVRSSPLRAASRGTRHPVCASTCWYRGAVSLAGNAEQTLLDARRPLARRAEGNNEYYEIACRGPVIAAILSRLWPGFQRDQWRRCSGAGDEVRSQPVPDGLGDDLGRLVLGVALRALLGEPLFAAGDVVVDVGDGRIGDDDLAGGDLDQVVVGDDRIDLRIRPPADRVDDHRPLGRADIDHEAMGRGHRLAAAMKIELQGVAHADGDALYRRAERRLDRRDVDRGKFGVALSGTPPSVACVP